MSEERATESEEARQRRVELLLREVVETINAGPVEGREVWREAAVDVVRAGVRVTDGPLPEATAGAPVGKTSFNPFGIGIPLILMGSVLVFLFPLVGLLMFAAAALMVVWGVGVTLLARS